jgi:hypothetical protein
MINCINKIGKAIVLSLLPMVSGGWVQAASSDIVCEINKVTQKGNTFSITEIRLINTGNHLVNDWKVRIKFDTKVKLTDAANINVLDSSGYSVIFSGKNNTKKIPVGGAVSFSFEGTMEQKFGKPECRIQDYSTDPHSTETPSPRPATTAAPTPKPTATPKPTEKPTATPAAGEIRVERLTNNPIITPDMYAEGFEDDISITGASVIRVPTWVANRLGNYYLYLGHHHGERIELFYADKIEGPYARYYAANGRPGVLDIQNTGYDGHLSFPDVHIIEAARSMRMYIHGGTKNSTPVRRGCDHNTSLASSSDGLQFKAVDYCLKEAYFRAWQVGNDYYAIVNGGEVHRSSDPLRGFMLFGTYGISKNSDVGPRHGGVKAFGNTAYLLYTSRGR